ncbi:universal stress protein UspA [Dictyobacter alpinus]|uniref:Universal stress protein UspA n=1 Tax=Dictyobacter alpinus TaxID=2014873 RepID=A0A402BFK1_9CHLR|nr:universal stress protein [Dictyobacter alpinus]GCE30165.1 universal stress protein UspA [Dictyobacter alpinus]
MFQHILVPLDGSPLAEQALPVAAHIARQMKIPITLLQISSMSIEYGPYFSQAGMVREAIIEEELAHARTYLQTLAQSPLLAGIATQSEALPGIAPASILSYVDAHPIDLVIMCSHGFSGLKRWLLGSVASQVGKHCTVPVLIVRAEQALSRDTAAKLRVLVALDGSSFAEAILEPAINLVATLAGPSQGTLHLTQLLQLPTNEDEFVYKQAGIDLAALRKSAVLAAGQYLQKVVEQLQHGIAAQRDVHVTWTTEECQDIAGTLLHMAEHGDSRGYNLLALTTHGHNALQAWMVGSIAERVLHEAHLPLLVVHPPQSRFIH